MRQLGCGAYNWCCWHCSCRCSRQPRGPWCLRWLRWASRDNKVLSNPQSARLGRRLSLQGIGCKTVAGLPSASSVRAVTVRREAGACCAGGSCDGQKVSCRVNKGPGSDKGTARQHLRQRSSLFLEARRNQGVCTPFSKRTGLRVRLCLCLCWTAIRADGSPTTGSERLQHRSVSSREGSGQQSNGALLKGTQWTAGGWRMVCRWAIKSQERGKGYDNPGWEEVLASNGTDCTSVRTGAKADRSGQDSNRQASRRSVPRPRAESQCNASTLVEPRGEIASSNAQGVGQRRCCVPASPVCLAL